MAHSCEACVVTCEDFRLHQRANGRNAVGDYIRSLGVDCDVVTRGGGIQDLVRPRLGFDDALLRDIEVSVKLHHVKTIHLVNHEDCGAYGGQKFSSREAELKRHRTDLELAREIVLRRFPGVEVVMAFAELEAGTTDEYVVRAVG